MGVEPVVFWSGRWQTYSLLPLSWDRGTRPRPAVSCVAARAYQKHPGPVGSHGPKQEDCTHETLLVRHPTCWPGTGVRSFPWPTKHGFSLMPALSWASPCGNLLPTIPNTCAPGLGLVPKVRVNLSLGWGYPKRAMWSWYPEREPWCIFWGHTTRLTQPLHLLPLHLQSLRKVGPASGLQTKREISSEAEVSKHTTACHWLRTIWTTQKQGCALWIQPSIVGPAFTLPLLPFHSPISVVVELQSKANTEAEGPGSQPWLCTATGRWKCGA